MPAYLNAIGTAVPDHDIHQAFQSWARGRLSERDARLFDRMATRAGIGHRWSVLPATEGSPVGPGGFYADEPHPGTAARMRLYAEAAPDLALRAIDDLGGTADVTHLVVASCTGFVAPGIDQIIADRLGLSPSTERLLIGFMGCYAAVAALRSARHIVRSDPKARVLVVTVELSTLHLQAANEIEPLLAMLQFGDGAAAAIVSDEPNGFEIDAPFAAALPDSAALIRWDVTDRGFAMHLSGEVPGRIGAALTTPELRATIMGEEPIDRWAIHAGGRSILDAVEHSLALRPEALAASRAVLAEAGNMSSATLMFVLRKLLVDRQRIRNGVAMAFGPGLAAEGFRFRTAG